ncbi:MAG: OmpA family protein [Planctomycetes bacterium]|jgi:outer membrane protein OmpA-like peptidoglycan-associated protein|nr:OmpA family protein [Phycisphaerae bacterium]NBB95040.1 OmpA family protein [Planctomycetota bacterium]
MSADEEKNNEIPLWVVSFTDMVTLLLSFFVMLQAFAHIQDPDLFYAGQGSFRRAIRGMGIPQWLLGKEERLRRDFYIKRHAVEPSKHPSPPEPIIDAEEDRIKQVLQELREKFDSSSNDITEETFDVAATPIRFDGTSTRLNRRATDYLDEFAVNVLQARRAANSTIYVIGLAPDVAGKRQQYVLGAQRAEAVRRYLQAQLRQHAGRWTVVCWGGGRRFGRLPEGTQIGIVVMGA